MLLHSKVLLSSFNPLAWLLSYSYFLICRETVPISWAATVLGTHGSALVGTCVTSRTKHALMLRWHLSTLYAFWAQERDSNSLSCLSYLTGDSFTRSSTLLAFSGSCLCTLVFRRTVTGAGQTELTRWYNHTLLRLQMFSTLIQNSWQKYPSRMITPPHIQNNPFFFPHITFLTHQMFSGHPLLFWGGTQRGFCCSLTLRGLVRERLCKVCRQCGREAAPFVMGGRASGGSAEAGC